MTAQFDDNVPKGREKDLESLLAQVPKDHPVEEEVNWGEPAGREEW